MRTRRPAGTDRDTERHSGLSDPRLTGWRQVRRRRRNPPRPSDVFAARPRGVGRVATPRVVPAQVLSDGTGDALSVRSIRVNASRGTTNAPLGLGTDRGVHLEGGWVLTMWIVVRFGATAEGPTPPYVMRRRLGSFTTARVDDVVERATRDLAPRLVEQTGALLLDGARRPAFRMRSRSASEIGRFVPKVRTARWVMIAVRTSMPSS